MDTASRYIYRKEEKTMADDILRELAASLAKLTNAFNASVAATADRLARLEAKPADATLPVSKAKTGKARGVAAAVPVAVAGDNTPTARMLALLAPHRNVLTADAEGVPYDKPRAGGLKYGVTITATKGDRTQAVAVEKRHGIVDAKASVIKALLRGATVTVCPTTPASPKANLTGQNGDLL